MRPRDPAPFLSAKYNRAIGRAEPPHPPRPRWHTRAIIAGFVMFALWGALIWGWG